jgi:hypothetical protein
VARWKEIWRRDTLGKVNGGAVESDVRLDTGGDEDDTALFKYNVEDVLRDFGQRLIELGRPVWQIQAAALRDATQKWERQRMLKGEKSGK